MYIDGEKDMNNILITVFTPTYNRARTLSRLWESLKKQTSYNFEWLIVDDGSNDDTRIVVDGLKKNTKEFSIRYKKKENGGKHRAINYGVSIAKGELFFIVDSDDWLPGNSISDIIYYYNAIRGDTSFAGVAGCKYDSTEKMSGTTFEGKYVDATSLERGKLGIKGEKAEVFLTDILKKYPFPEFQNEKFLSEAIVWNKIASDGYRLRWFNENIYYYEYQDEGITKHLRKNYRSNPIGYLTYISNEMKYLHVKGIKKYIWCGRCIETVTGIISRKRVQELLQIHSFEYLISKMIFALYSLMR